ncbi:alpha/beta hydrolase family protein [Microlunatus soli]|uniref:Alpha/beta hydrolase family protein n=1 Tax=Microlunatus soli TaxID=630515 RepID=A0A1H1VWR8_9ACTN|nr:prolyl oligopeptidase family serine peptidase [Microlunatus soli]SDS88901.1 Alpha/beta hydrolase family protein [Microlunatus soli]
MSRTRLRYGDHPSHWVDLTVPDRPTDRPLPVIIFLHGGYWRDLHAADQVEPLIADLADRELALVNVEYRRTGDDPQHGDGGWPATFNDVAAAIDLLGRFRPGGHRDRPAADLDGVVLALDRVVAVGHSAGAHLAAWAAARPGLPTGAPGAGPRVRLSGYVSLAGVLDLITGAEQRLDDGAVQALLGGEPADRPEVYPIASPLSRVPIGVPGVCLHGTADDRVPIDQSVRFVEAAVAAGDRCRLVTLPGVDHFSYLDPTSAAWSAAKSAALELIG